MILPITKEFSDFSVRFRPLPATKAFLLAKKVGALVLPLLKSIDLSDFKKDIDFSAIFNGISDALANLSDKEAVGILVDSLKGSTITAPGLPPVEINDESNLDTVFQGELETMYQIVFEAWKYNKLAPFKFAARFGLQMSKTSTSDEAANSKATPGQKLALSGASTPK